VHFQNSAGDASDEAAEKIRLVGYAVLDGGYTALELEAFSTAFDRARRLLIERHGGLGALRAIDEHNTVRAPLSVDHLFLEIASNDAVLGICRRLMGQYIVLNQQNGIINPPHGIRYNQGAYHRDLPFQHFVSSRPLAVNALFCLDEFTLANGATCVVPASHKEEAFPSDPVVNATEIQLSAPRGSYIILDALLYHRGGVNRTDTDRRAVNHLFSIPLIRPQINLPAVLGPDYTTDEDLRRLLGYDLSFPGSIEAYYATRRKQLNV
jgi:ectoine hydroxylase-related dioxygenase (phytanoyl-CoA dioxygenase family)